MRPVYRGAVQQQRDFSDAGDIAVVQLRDATSGQGEFYLA